jgi:hypothetical protein
MMNNEQKPQLHKHIVRRSYLDKVKDDLVISREIFNKCRKYSEKWHFYRGHIEWLESEIDALS